MTNYRKRAQKSLRQQLPSLTINSKGYVKWPHENLIEGVQLEQFEDELRQGSGDELRIKFCAIHSSSALAVNTFAKFKDVINLLTILDIDGFHKLVFERQCPTGLKQATPPNIDVWLESSENIIAIESKFLEYFTPKFAKYSLRYMRDAFPGTEDCWWNLLEKSKSAGKQYLDVAQLVKHYLGLIHYLETTKKTSMTLLYLYWEPQNADQLDVCLQHRKEIATFSDQVAESKVTFKSMAYANLWYEWELISELQEHASNLRERYDVEI